MKDLEINELKHQNETMKELLKEFLQMVYDYDMRPEDEVLELSDKISEFLESVYPEILNKEYTYYLDDLSNEQYFKILEIAEIKPIKNRVNSIDYFDNKWCLVNHKNILSSFINAKTLF